MTGARPDLLRFTCRFEIQACGRRWIWQARCHAAGGLPPAGKLMRRTSADTWARFRRNRMAKEFLVRSSEQRFGLHREGRAESATWITIFTGKSGSLAIYDSGWHREQRAKYGKDCVLRTRGDVTSFRGVCRREHRMRTI